MEFLSAIQGNP
ncbi:MAG: hypothetical protein DKT66_04255 [Candidatus Melainabacteria bacterium]|nr:MAG: hypothetical protein DKT66_04255 [Candidatus Melainabacteria bacterium]